MKKFLLILMMLGMIAASCCVDQEKPQEEGKLSLRYGGQYYPGEFLLYGNPTFWDEYDLEVEHILFSSGGEGNEALVSGRVDVNCGSDTKTVALFNAMPGEALVIGTVQKGNRYATIVPIDSEYQSWEDLKGKTVATRLGTGAESVLRKYYTQEGYTWEDFNYVNLQTEDMIAALENGQIEAFTVWEPTAAIAEAQGVGRVLRTYGDIALAPASIHTTKTYAYAHEEEIVRFLAAHLDKQDMIKNDPVGAANLASYAAAQKGVEVSPDAFEKVYGRLDFSIDFDEAVIDSMYETAEFLKSQNKIDEIPTVEYDKSFLEKAKKLQEEKG